MSKLFVFGGISVTPEEIQTSLANAIVMEPAAHGDLIRLPLEPGDSVVLIDGHLTHKTPLRLLELREMIARGNDVIGGGGLGAARAADLAGIGMHGSGIIYRLYRRGILSSDDEVLNEQGGEALVDIRATCRRACRIGLFSHDEAETMVAIAASLPIELRRYDVLVETAKETGLAPATLRQFQERLSMLRVDLRRHDALRLIDRLARGWRPQPTLGRRIVSTGTFQAWKDEEQRIDPPGSVSPQDVLTFAQSLSVDYPRFHYEVMLRAFLASCEESPDELPLFGSDQEELERRVATHAIARGAFSKTSLQPRLESQWLTDHERTVLDLSAKVARVVVRAFQVHPGIIHTAPLLTALGKMEALPQVIEGCNRIRSFNQALLNRWPDRNPAGLVRASVLNWFYDRWARTDHPLVGLRERGFLSERDLYRRASKVYVFDLLKADYRDFHIMPNGD